MIDCDQQKIALLLTNDPHRLDPDVLQHLEACDLCRQTLDVCAASEKEWKDAHKFLQQSEFDVANCQAFSAGGTTIGFNSHPVSVLQVLDSLAPSDDPHKLGRLGEYEISAVIGIGGMGVVLKAVDPALDRVVAIKVMAPSLANSSKARQRFAREARAAAAVIHPNVIPIHRVSNEQTLPYLVMAYIRGDSLQKKLDQDAKPTLIEILRIGSQIASGLSAAHAQGLVHRDIKPANILLEGDVDRITITDFGLARAVDDNTVTQHGSIAGTPMYMSPEQARGEQVDQLSDLFSLGSVLYALSTGQPPFRSESSYGAMRKIIDDTPKPLRQLNSSIPEWFSKIVERLMSKEKGKRFSSAEEVHRILSGCLNHLQKPQFVGIPKEVMEWKSTANYHGKARKNPVAKMSVLAVLFCFLGVAAAGVFWNATQTEIAKTQDELTRFVGTWEVMSMEDRGTIVPRERLKDYRFVFSKDALMQVQGSWIRTSDFQFDQNKSPKQIELTSENSAELGIYRFRDDGSLQICLSETSNTRAFEFESFPDTANQILITLKKVDSTLDGNVSTSPGIGSEDDPFVARLSSFRLKLKTLEEEKSQLTAPSEIEEINARIEKVKNAMTKLKGQIRRRSEIQRLARQKDRNQFELLQLQESLEQSEIETTKDGIQSFLSEFAYKADSPEIARIIEQLGSSDVEQREAAKETLRTLPQFPLRQLQEVAKSSNSEITKQAEKLLAEQSPILEDKYKKTLRFIQLKEIPAAEDAILNSIQVFSHNRQIVELAKTILSDSNSNFLNRNLRQLITTSEDDSVLEIVTFVLRQTEDVSLADDYLRLTTRANDYLKLEAALALADIGNRDAMVILVSLMRSSEISGVRSESKTAFAKFTGTNLPLLVNASVEIRDQQLKAFDVWLEEKGQTAPITFPLRIAKSIQSNLAGNTLVALSIQGRVVEYDIEMNEVWSFNCGYPRTAEKMSNGNYLIACCHEKRFIEVSPEKEVVREIKARSPEVARELENGNLLMVAGGNEGSKVWEITSSGELVWERDCPGRYYADAHKLDNENYLVVLLRQGGTYLREITSEGKVEWEIWLNEFEANSLDGVVPLDNGNILLSFIDVVMELDPVLKTVVWKLDNCGARDAIRLPNGNTLVLSGQRLSEFDPNGFELWSLEGMGYGSVRR